MSGTLRRVSRRDFLRLCGTAGAGLVIGMRLGPDEAIAAEGETGAFEPNAFLSIDTQGVATIWVARSELGQGAHTVVPMIVAEELEADWSKIRVERAVLDPRYGDQTTAGSTTVREGWRPLRLAGAAAREMLIAAAAATWGVSVAACRAESGEVIHPASGRRLGYGALVRRAAALPVPQKPRLKDPKQFRFVGKSLPRLDSPAKVDGSARFGIDTRIPGMRFAALARSPVFGGKPARVEDSRARQVPGVRDVIQLRTGVAVVADSTWAAFEGRDALRITWDEGPNAGLDSAGIRKILFGAVTRAGVDGRKAGDAEALLARAPHTLTADYEVPFAYHGPIEPMNCVAQVTGGRCEIWAPTQAPEFIRQAVAGYLEIPPQSVKVNVTLSGGGFGRRAMPDFAAEAAILSKRAGTPIQVVWSRDDDMQHDYYRPVSLHRLSAAIEGGRLTAWKHRVVTPSILATIMPGAVPRGYDEGVFDGAANIPYAIPNLHVDSVLVETPIPIGYWRSVYASQNALATESFLDEVAAAMHRDPVAFRRPLLAKSPRHLRALELAASKSGWGSPPPPGRARGVALCESFGGIAAEVAEVSVGPDGVPRVHRVTCAIDCGIAVHPDMVRQQVEGAVGYALTPVLHGPITIAQGRVEQGSFADYPLLRMNEMPDVDVHIVPSRAKPGGVGEVGVPPLSPAVVNAFSALAGRRIRTLPIRAEDLKG